MRSNKILIAFAINKNHRINKPAIIVLVPWFTLIIFIVAS